LLDTESVLQEVGVLEAYIADKNLRVRAPLSQTTTILDDATSREALIENKVISDFPKDMDSLLTTISRDSRYDFAYPIRVWNDSMGNFETIGIAKIIFIPQQVLESHFNIRDIQKKAIIILVIPLVIIFIGMYLFTILPIRRLRESVETLSQTDRKEVIIPGSFDELGKLAESINTTLNTRALFSHESKGESGEAFGINLPEVNQESHSNFWQEIMNKLDTGIIVVTHEKIIKEVNNKAVEMLKLVQNGGIGEAVSTIITDRDVLFAMNDLVEKLGLNPLESPSITVEYGGPGRRLQIKAIKVGNDSDVRYVFLCDFIDYGN